MSKTAARYFFGNVHLTENSITFMRKTEAQASGVIMGERFVRVDSFSVMVGKLPDGTRVAATRVIHYKKRPSLHKCGARCRNGKPGGTCECSCGGRNHGIG